jgi:hypothetical protein
MSRSARDFATAGMPAPPAQRRQAGALPGHQQRVKIDPRVVNAGRLCQVIDFRFPQSQPGPGAESWLPAVLAILSRDGQVRPTGSEEAVRAAGVLDYTDES